MVLLSLNFIITTVILADMIYAHYYGDVPSFLSLGGVGMLRWVAPSVLKLLRPIYAVYYLDIIAGIILSVYYIRACKRVPCLIRNKRVAFSFGIILVGLILSVPAVRLVMKDKTGWIAYTNLQRDVCAQIGLLPYHFTDAVIFLASGRQGIGETERQHVRRFFYEKGKRQPSSSRMFGVAHGRNLIIIHSESLQAFPIGLKIHGQPVTPRISQFAKESLHFLNFHDQTYLGTTADCEFTSLQSLHPLSSGVVAEVYNNNQFHGLPAILSKQGYGTFSAVAAPGSFWSMDKMHARLGFQQSFFEENYDTTERIGQWLADREFFDQTIPILRVQSKPFMAYLLTSSNHHPFDLPKKYRVLKLGSLEGTLLGNYLHSVHYFDRAFGEFVDRLRDSGLLDQSIIVLYGDHQAFLGKIPELAHLLGFAEKSEYHHLLLRKKLPLFIRLPKGEAAGNWRVAGGHLDIAPTLLSLLGIAPDNSVMLGQDLTQGEDSFVVFRDGSFTDGMHYFVNRFGPVSNSPCYEVATGQNIDCSPLEEKRAQALEQLRISDLILQGNLIPFLLSMEK